MARGLVVATTAALLLAGCGSSGGGGGTTAGSGSASGARVGVKAGVLVGSNGHTLYVNTVDTSAHISCTGGCANVWPPVSGPATIGSGLPAADFGTVKRPDGSRQETYLGHPLYEFSGDHGAGDRTGNGQQDAGGRWHTALVGGAMPSGGSSGGASSSGYTGY